MDSLGAIVSFVFASIDGEAIEVDEISDELLLGRFVE
jgi:hypothetical protein